MRPLFFPAIFCFAALISAARAQENADAELVGELMAFHGSRAIVSAMTTHCYETTGLDGAYKTANDNWYLRNVGFLDLADRVITKLGGTSPGQIEAAETYGGTQIMSAFNQAEDKEAFCRSFLERVENGALDIDKQLAGILKRAQDIAAD
ncbi:hypothetical protein [Devosia sp. LC5]|uniref:hypothetical protein n=1 Tax=Devosia sp. LC5 TaxID=1502724 RepID=UPI00126966FF|nr:hypothetical protein [Devosia sp. LC5]